MPVVHRRDPSGRRTARAASPALRVVAATGDALGLGAPRGFARPGGAPWIADLPFDEIVPMVFRMGPEGEVVRQQLAAGGDFRLARCRDAIGVSTDEPLPRVPGRRRRYVFDGGPASTERQWPP